MLPTASIGKILLLIEVSARLTSREFSGFGILGQDAAGCGGRLRDLAAPAGAVVPGRRSRDAGGRDERQPRDQRAAAAGRALGAVRARTESLGLMRTALLDLVRDSRGPDDAPQLSVGSTAELSWLFGALARNEIVDALTSQRVMGWLSLNSDLSMVASAFGLDPLSHRGPDHGTLLVNKTGTDDGVRLRGRRPARYRSARSPTRSRCSSTMTALAARLRVLDAAAHGGSGPARVRTQLIPQFVTESCTPFLGLSSQRRTHTLKHHRISDLHSLTPELPEVGRGRIKPESESDPTDQHQLRSHGRARLPEMQDSMKRRLLAALAAFGLVATMTGLGSIPAMAEEPVDSGRQPSSLPAPNLRQRRRPRRRHRPRLDGDPDRPPPKPRPSLDGACLDRADRTDRAGDLHRGHRPWTRPASAAAEARRGSARGADAHGSRGVLRAGRLAGSRTTTRSVCPD